MYKMTWDRKVKQKLKLEILARPTKLSRNRKSTKDDEVHASGKPQENGKSHHSSPVIRTEVEKFAKIVRDGTRNGIVVEIQHR